MPRTSTPTLNIQTAASLSQGASMNLLITIFYDWSRVVAGYLTWAAPLAVRIVVGWVFMWTGWQKLHFLPRMIENFSSTTQMSYVARSTWTVLAASTLHWAPPFMAPVAASTAF